MATPLKASIALIAPLNYSGLITRAPVVMTCRGISISCICKDSKLIDSKVSDQNGIVTNISSKADATKERRKLDIE